MNYDLDRLLNRVLMLTWSTNHFDTEISWKFANMIFLWNHTILLQLHKSWRHGIIAMRVGIIVWVADITINGRHSYFVNEQIMMQTTFRILFDEYFYPDLRPRGIKLEVCSKSMQTSPLFSSLYTSGSFRRINIKQQDPLFNQDLQLFK